MDNNNETMQSEEERKKQKRFFSMLGFGLALPMGLTAAVSYGVSYFFPDFSKSFLWECLLSCFLFLVALPLGLLLLRTAGKPTLPEKTHTNIGLFFILAAIAVDLALMGYYLGDAIDYMRYGASYLETETVDYSSFSALELALYFALILVIEPVAEEFFFRRTVTGLLSPYGWAAAIFLSSLFYGLFHCSFENFFYVFNLGCVLSYAYLRTGKLRFPIFIHALFNLIFTAAPVAVYAFIASPTQIETFETKAAELASAGESGIQEFYTYVLENQTTAMGYILLMLLSSLSMGLAIFGCVMLFVRLRRVKMKPGKVKLPWRSVGDTVFMSVGVLVYVVLTVTLGAIAFFS